MKKLINEPGSVIADVLTGIEAACPLVTVDHEARVITRATPKPAGTVALVSGGGSGHEPLHGGYVGEGMLDAAVVGDIFTSPTPDQIFTADQQVDRGAGVLHIVKNYTGDVMNFEMAAELAGASGTEVATVLVADDVAVENSLYTAGRRGVAGTLVVEKIAGAAAEMGWDLEQVRELAQAVADNARSMGVALSSVTVPARGCPSFDLGDEDIELGIGIHGEPGRRRVPKMPAAELAQALLDPILEELPPVDPQTGCGVILLVNGMGGTPLLELYIMCAEVQKILAQHGVRIERQLVGNYVTSLDMQGCSVTLVRATPQMLSLWDAPVRTTALRW